MWFDLGSDASLVVEVVTVRVVTFKKPQLSLSETNLDFIMSVEAISTDGEVLPLLLIVQGISHL